MKQLLLAIIYACIVLSSLSDSAQVNAQAIKRHAADSAKLSGNWYLQPVLASDTVTGHLPSLGFDLLRGKFKGFTGCNEMSGSFRVQADGLWFDKDILLTKISCEGYNEKDFIINLLRVTRYQIKNGVLTLFIDNSPISKWLRKTDSRTVSGKP